MTISFLGAAHEVTGSCSLLTVAGKRILIDCGMEQGPDIYENCELPVSPADIDAIVLTHAHIDHSGKLPALTARGFTGRIYATGATVRLCRIMLLDSAHIQESEAEWRNRKALRSGKKPYTPLYTSNDVEATCALMRACSYGEEIEIFDGIKVRFNDAGHLLGSSSVFISVKEPDAGDADSTVFLFSGDLGNVSRPLIRDPQMPDHADYVVIESTYGDRLHGERKNYTEQLTNILRDTFSRGGNVVIPAFAIGRTQEFLYLMQEIKSQKLLGDMSDFPVWIDSPLAIEATRIYAGDLIDYYDDETLAKLNKGINVLDFVGLNTAVSSDESKAINFDNTPKVIISASGMCEAGRIRHHLKHNLWRADSTVLFVGYQAEGTLGRRLLEGAPTVKLFSETIDVRARIEAIDGISGHADRDMMVRWLSSLDSKPRMVFVNHGEDEVCDLFAAHIKETLGFESCAPYCGSVYNITVQGADALEETGVTIVREGNSQRIERIDRIEQGKREERHDSSRMLSSGGGKSSAGGSANSDAERRRNKTSYDKMLMSLERLTELLRSKKDSPSKELGRITGTLNELLDKWDDL